ncbi:MAG: hypothetical protein Nk1A_6840 [Endomicrobiia bacterium]|nr:MAG: hypothetical protein Nk1A_6840 [Endomicrobiia bacterium]
MTIPVSHKVADNILINKHDIRMMPLIDSLKEKHIKLIDNEWRALKRYPVTYDFFANIIDRNKDIITEIIEDVSRDYYELSVSEGAFERYLGYCENHTKKQSLKRQLMADVSFGFVLIKSKNLTNIEYKAPFRLMKIVISQDGGKIYKFYLLKQIFSGLITGECYKNGGEGFIRIPGYLYPITTQAYKGILKSHNPIYKTNILGITKKTHKGQRYSEMDREEFLKEIFPEYYRDGKLKVSQPALQGSLWTAIQGVSNLLPTHELVNNLEMGKNGGIVRLHYKTI